MKNKSTSPKISNTLVVRPPTRTPHDINKWKNAIRAADYGRIAQLVELFDDLYIDPVLSEAVGRRIRAITNAEIVFSINNKNVSQIDDLIDTPEFENLLTEIILSKFYPQTVIEFDFSNGFKTHCIDRRHFNIKDKVILRSLSDTDGIPYENNDFILSLEGKNFGIFLNTAPFVIFKRNGFGDFAEFCELFGIDTLIGLYDPEDDRGRVEMETAFKNRGSGASMTMSKNSDVKVVGTKGSGTVDIHDRFLNKCDEQILIAVLGQTMTTKDGSSYSQGKVHADTEDEINKADRRFVQRILNKEILPRLEKRGYPVAGGWFHFAEQGENLTKAQQLDIALKVSEKVPVDDNYWYENYGIPKPKYTSNGDKNFTKKGLNDKEQEPSINKQTTSKQVKQLSLWDKIRDFFEGAPR